jgi:hypothetical protein
VRPESHTPIVKGNVNSQYSGTVGACKISYDYEKILDVRQAIMAKRRFKMGFAPDFLVAQEVAQISL